MAARDTFEWFVATIHNPDEDVTKRIRQAREYLLTLRSEDEQQRFVEEVMVQLRSQLMTKTVS